MRDWSGDLTEAEWRHLEPLLPTGNNRCGRWRGHRQVSNGILHRVRTGVQWRDLPERYGPWKTVYERLRRWSADGTWERLLQRAQADAAGRIDWDVSLGSTSIRAHQHAAGARKAPPPAASKGAAAMEHKGGRPWARLCARLAGVVQELRHSVAPEEASSSRPSPGAAAVKQLTVLSPVLTAGQRRQYGAEDLPTLDSRQRVICLRSPREEPDGVCSGGSSSLCPSCQLDQAMTSENHPKARLFVRDYCGHDSCPSISWALMDSPAIVQYSSRRVMSCDFVEVHEIAGGVVLISVGDRQVDQMRQRRGVRSRGRLPVTSWRPEVQLPTTSCCTRRPLAPPQHLLLRRLASRVPYLDAGHFVTRTQRDLDFNGAVCDPETQERALVTGVLGHESARGSQGADEKCQDKDVAFEGLSVRPARLDQHL
ncbi:IS5 family transposase [Streptomyces sp. NPDC085944]|uniref:IS5 family transposase n=1 Tax=Streptomyces sp. NPDC085944 TaxID=3154962 RepID=UPI003422AF83